MSSRLRRTACACLLLAACNSKPAGELMLVITSDTTPGGDRPDFDALQLNITNDAFTSRLFTEFGTPGLPTSFPATFAIVSNGDPSLALHLRIYSGLVGTGSTAVGAPQHLREILTTVPTDRAVSLPVSLEWACLGNAYDKGPPDHYVESRCPEGTTCIAGSCADWAIDPGALEAFDRDSVFGGGCFDTVPCLATGALVELDRERCTIPKPADLTQLNVGVVTADGRGVCGTDGTCYVALNANHASGWLESGSVLQLPPGYCHPAPGIEPNRVRAIVVSTACAPKPAGLPQCGPWSGVGDAGVFDVGGPSLDGGVRD